MKTLKHAVLCTVLLCATHLSWAGFSGWVYTNETNEAVTVTIDANIQYSGARWTFQDEYPEFAGHSLTAQGVISAVVPASGALDFYPIAETQIGGWTFGVPGYPSGGSLGSRSYYRYFDIIDWIDWECIVWDSQSASSFAQVFE